MFRRCAFFRAFQAEDLPAGEQNPINKKRVPCAHDHKQQSGKTRPSQKLSAPARIAPPVSSVVKANARRFQCNRPGVV